MAVRIENFDLKVLAMDIGAGTQNILIYDSAYENAYKIIMPSPTVILSKRVSGLNKNIVFCGETMGGGAVTDAVLEHIKKGYKVSMTERAARTIRDDMDYIEKIGIELIDENEILKYVEKGYEKIEMRDVVKESIEKVLKEFGLPNEPEVVAVAVEDHGLAEKGEKDRECRFRLFSKMIPGSIDKFGYEAPPRNYTRMRGVKETLNREYANSKHVIMDSKIAALFGANYSVNEKEMIAIDVGNGHTTAGMFEGNVLQGIFEHHTTTFTRSVENARMHLIKFAEGSLTQSEVMEDGGHGVYVSKALGYVPTYITGPRRNELKNMKLKFQYLAPYGDHMLAGSVGLVECAKKKFKI
ncbi:MAG: DUF1786 family protein [Thermoplasmata archaeon]